ncbi:hypothetical protein [Corynebacterium cystitidis]|uniref:Uncharacterized protein n=1 Tax=Corynebacterium cystitidis DSM 20524 TaxID=1121357 RepID=A0A1H9WR20_9CORY|nr:hypothetical protein [Corynebacterium cystitidis]WJY81074.1 hypothetical protein CCYS_00450 [Corynebacterium cystitidis DSM 20524]SES36264.1 hypothetical protein SAMN05661109_02858 [Corynebacterium cystitidis DSM 20524]SNV90192.1 Uncharacterised protein [Corynebacterium cystitidis]
MKKSLRQWCIHALFCLILLFGLFIVTIGGPTKLIGRVEPGSTYYTLYAIATVLGSLAFLNFTVLVFAPRWPRWLGVPTASASFDGARLNITSKANSGTYLLLFQAANMMITGTTELWAIFHGDQPGERRSGTIFIAGLVFLGAAIFSFFRVHHRHIESFSAKKYSFSYPAKDSALHTTSTPDYQRRLNPFNLPWALTVTADFTTTGNPKELPTIRENKNGESQNCDIYIPLTSNVSRTHIARWLTTGTVSPQLHALGVPYEQPPSTQPTTTTPPPQQEGLQP